MLDRHFAGLSIVAAETLGIGFDWRFLASGPGGQDGLHLSCQSIVEAQ